MISFTTVTLYIIGLLTLVIWIYISKRSLKYLKNADYDFLIRFFAWSVTLMNVIIICTILINFIILLIDIIM